MVRVHLGAAGLVCLSTGDRLHLHLAVRPQYWLWGFERSWYDGPLYSVGLGPLFKICW